MPVPHQDLHFLRRASCRSPRAGRVGGVAPEPHHELAVVEARAAHHAAPLLVVRAVWRCVPSTVLVRARRVGVIRGCPRLTRVTRRIVCPRLTRVRTPVRLAAGGAPALGDAERLERTACLIVARIARTPFATPARAEPRGAEARPTQLDLETCVDRHGQLWDPDQGCVGLTSPGWIALCRRVPEGCRRGLASRTRPAPGRTARTPRLCCRHNLECNRRSSRRGTAALG